jgi:hypothetical protein
MKIPEICRYCGGRVRKGSTREIYGKSNEMIYICTNCNAYVMCHKVTGLPMGKLANTVLRLKRQETHNIFDSFWTEQGWTRDNAYRWLAESMGIPNSDAHIANFEMDECEHAVRLCREYKNTKEAA